MDNSTTPQKRCSCCKHYFPATSEYFTRCKSSKDGFYWRCKSCRALTRRNYVPHKQADKEKQCTKCHQVKILKEFHRDRTFPDGYKTICKACRSKIEGFKYVAPVPDGFMRCSRCQEIFPKTIEYFVVSSRHPEGLTNPCRKCFRIASKVCRDKYREKYLAISADWRNRNRERFNAMVADWARRNPEKRRVSLQRRHARKADLPSTMTSLDWKCSLEYWDNKCCVCGKSEDFWTILAQEHWKPIAKGGGFTPDNIVPMCHARKGVPSGQVCCNNEKGKKDPEQWLLKKYGKRRAAEIVKSIQDYFDWMKHKS